MGYMDPLGYIHKPNPQTLNPQTLNPQTLNPVRCSEQEASTWRPPVSFLGSRTSSWVNARSFRGLGLDGVLQFRIWSLEFGLWSRGLGFSSLGLGLGLARIRLRSVRAVLEFLFSELDFHPDPGRASFGKSFCSPKSRCNALALNPSKACYVL